MKLFLQDNSSALENVLEVGIAAMGPPASSEAAALLLTSLQLIRDMSSWVLKGTHVP